MKKVNDHTGTKLSVDEVVRILVKTALELDDAPGQKKGTMRLVRPYGGIDES